MDFKVERGDYRTQAEYQAALRDKLKIDRLLKSCDTNTPEGVERLYGILQSGELRFETALGNRFDDAVYELRERMETAAPQGKAVGRAGNKQKKQTGKKQDKKPEQKSGKQIGKKPERKPKQKETRSGKAGRAKTRERKSLSDYDPQMQQAILAELRRSERRRRLLIAALLLVMAGAFGGYWMYYRTARNVDARNEQLANLIDSQALMNMDRGNGMYTATIINEDGEEVHLEVLDKYKTLFNSNRHLIGWIEIADKDSGVDVINLPVMQWTDNEYYLLHDADGKDNRTGALFLDCSCDAVKGNDNFIIYGHHLTSGRMFSFLGDYESESYYEKHPYIRFDTIYEEGTYQVMYAFRSRVYDTNEVVFKYYQFIDAYSPEEFNSYMQEMASLAYYDTGVTAQYGDQLLTLSTCDYQEQNGRFVVVAKKIR